MDKIKLLAFITSCTILTVACSTKKSNVVDERYPIEQRIINTLSEKEYPGDLPVSIVNDLNNNSQMLETVISGLGENIQRADLSKKPMIASNIFLLEKVLTSISIEGELKKYSDKLTVDYMTNNPIYGTDQDSLDLYKVLKEKPSFRFRLIQSLEQSLINNDQQETNFIRQNLDYLNSVAFVDKDQLDFFVPQSTYVAKYDNFDLAIVPTINGKVLEIRLAVLNNSTKGEYLQLAEPTISGVKKFDWKRIDLLEDTEFRYFKANAQKAFNYKFLVDEKPNEIKDFVFRIKAQEKVLQFPIE